jgi:Flp pilus assembly secretin CpaC
VKAADDALDGAGKGVPAEIVATLYDQSLDALAPLAWPPGLSSLFRSESSLTAKQNLLIFVTPTIIDPAGKRVNDPSNLPFDPEAVPTQASNR